MGDTRHGPQGKGPPESVGPAGEVAPRCFLPGWGSGRGGAGVTWRPGDDLLLHCAGREPALGVEVGCRRETSQSQARSGPCGASTRHGHGEDTVRGPVPPSCAPRPAFCRRIRRVCQLSSRPFAQGETRLGSGASQRLLSSRLVSRLTPASHLTPFLYANPASFASQGPGRGALTPPPDTPRSQSRPYRQRCIHSAEWEGGKDWVGIEMAELSILTASEPERSYLNLKR